MPRFDYVGPWYKNWGENLRTGTHFHRKFKLQGQVFVRTILVRRSF